MGQIIFKDVSRIYGDFYALDKVSFDIGKGIVGIVGMSGATMSKI